MATTTPNFGWTVPTSSDLVKNGATAIETLGDAIDASLVDLKGGTTGQVLAKASNTDMDFTWSAGASVPTSLGFAAGKNKIINGDFEVWQRGSSFSGTNQLVYTADRWLLNDFGGQVSNVARSTFTPGTAPVAGYEGEYYATWSRAAAGTNASFFTQKIEDVRTFANQTVTLSFWAKASASETVGVYLGQIFGSGGSSAVYTSVTDIAITTSWVRYTTNFTLASLAGKTIGTSSFLDLTFQATTAQGGFAIDIWGVQLEAGSTATAFQTATGTVQGELAACQRYYQKSYEQATAPGTDTLFNLQWSVGGNASNDWMLGTIIFPVVMRTAPTVTIYTKSGTTGAVSDAGGTSKAANSGVAAYVRDRSVNVYNASGGTVTAAFGGFAFHYTANGEL
jgi:hypothetical protein